MALVAGSRAELIFDVNGADTSRREVETVADALRRLNAQSLQRLSGEMGAIDSRISSLQSTMGKLVSYSIAGFSLAALIGKVNGAIDVLGDLDDMAQKTGSSVENLSRLQKVANAFGAEFSNVDAALNKLSKGMAETDDETSKVQKALGALGVSARDSAKKLRDPAEVMIDAAKALQRYQDGAAKTALIIDLLGKSGADLLPYLNDVADNVDEFGSVSKEAAARAAEMQDNLGRLRVKGDELATTIGLAAAPAVNDLASAVLDVMKNNRDLASGQGVDWADNMAVGVARLLDVAVLLPRMLSAVGSSFKVVAADIKLAGTVAENANPIKAALKVAKGGSPTKDIQTALDERNQVLADANVQWDSLWNKPANEFEQAMLKRLAARGANSGTPTPLDDPKETLNYKPGTGDAAEAKQEAEAYTALIAAIRAKTVENRREIDIGFELSESQKTRIKLDEDLATGKLKLSKAHRVALDAALAEQAASEKSRKEKQAEIDVARFIDASTASRTRASAALAVEYQMYGKSADAREIAMVAVKAEADTQKKLAEMRVAGLPISDKIRAQLEAEKEARISVEQATLGQTKALTYAAQLAEENKRFGLDYIADDKARAAATLELDAEVWRERIALAGEGTEAQRKLQSNFDQWYRNQSLKPQLEEQKRIWQSVENTAHETFISIFDSGKSAFDRLKDTLKNGLLDLLYQMTVKKFLINIGASVGMAGTVGVAQAATSVAETAGSMGSIAGTVGSAYGLISGGMTLGGGLGTGFMGSLAGGLNGAGMGSGLTSAVGLNIGNGIAGVIGQGAATTLSTGLSAFAAAAPYLAVIAGAYSIYKSLDDSGTYHTGGASYADSSGSRTIRAESIGFQHTRTAAETESMTAGLAQGVVGLLDSTALAFGKTAGYTAATAFADDTSKDGAWGALVIQKMGQDVVDWNDTRNSKWAPKEFADGEKGQQQYLAALTSSVRTALDSIGLPAWAKTMLSSVASDASLEDLAKVVDQINKTQSALGAMRSQLAGFASLSDTAVSALMAASGGIDKLFSNASAYYDAFYTEAEKNRTVNEQIAKQLAAVNLQMPATREGFRSLVEAQMQLGDQGAESVAVLLGVSAAFAQLHPDVEAATTDLSSYRSALTDAYNAESEALKSGITRMGSFATSLRELSKSALLGALSPLSPQQKYAEAKSQYEAVASAARKGDDKAQDSYQDAYTAFLEASRAVFASSAEYQLDFNYAQAMTAEMAQWADTRVTVDQAQLDALKAQVSGIIEINKSVLSVRDALQQYNTARAQQTASLPVPLPPIPVPVPFYQSEGRTNNAALEIGLTLLRDEIAALRVEQQRQTGDQIAAQAEAVNDSAEAIAKAITTSRTSAQERVTAE